jgi:hypothetical protein
MLTALGDIDRREGLYREAWLTYSKQGQELAGAVQGIRLRYCLEQHGPLSRETARVE